jgi:glutaredoxin-like YruB-family protein
MSKSTNLDTVLTEKNRKIIVYSTPTCHYCTMAKNYFTKMGVQYEDINVGMDRAAAEVMIKKSGQMGVPVIDIDGQIIVGFQPEVFEKLINSR